MRVKIVQAFSEAITRFIFDNTTTASVIFPLSLIFFLGSLVLCKMYKMQRNRSVYNHFQLNVIKLYTALRKLAPFRSTLKEYHLAAGMHIVCVRNNNHGKHVSCIRYAQCVHNTTCNATSTQSTTTDINIVFKSFYIID